MSRPRTSRSLRAGLALVVASAAAFGAPALASANPAPPEPPDTFVPTHTFDAPVIDGNFGEWSEGDFIGPARPGPSYDRDQAAVSMRYDCRAGRLNLSVEALDGVALIDDPALHGGTFNVAGSPDSVTFTGASPEAEFSFARDAGDNIVGWEMSIPLDDGALYVGVGETGVIGGNPAEFSGAIDISCPLLEVEKTAEGEHDLLQNWSVAKTVMPPPDLEADATSVDVDYTVTVTKLAPTVINRRLAGSITATNEGDIAVPDVVLSEKGNDIGAGCRIVGASNDGVAIRVKTKTAHIAVGTLEAGASATAYYVCSYAPKGEAATSGVNYGQVNWPGPEKGGRYDVDGVAFDFGSPDQSYRDTVSLVDKFQDEKPTVKPVSETKAFTATRTLAVPEQGCVTYTNTATLVDGKKKDWHPSASVSTEVCNTEEGGVTVIPTEIADPTPVVPVKPSTKPVRRSSLRAAIRGPKRVRQGARARYRVRIANRGRHTARRVVTRFIVPRGMKVVRVLRAPGNTVVRGRTVRMRFNRINIKRAKNVVVVVKARNGARVGNRRIVVKAKAANLKGQKITKTAKRVRITPGL